MAGGLLNLISNGNNNVILTGNPSKTFFKVTYAKYTNFGLQKFRIDYDGLRDLRLTEPSTFTFKMPRYAELLMDTYLVMNLPAIWSPIYNPCAKTANTWAPYEYRWIRELGTNMISEISITCGSQTIQKYSGEYLRAMVERDFSAEKKDLFDKMTGNVKELYDPANAYERNNAYPSAYYSETGTSEPSIRGSTLYVPINTWFTLDSRCAFPMISLQYNELYVSITMRPIQELFQVRDVFDLQYSRPYVQPDFNQSYFQMYRFLQTPPDIVIAPDKYANKISTWNADIHLMSTYCFLSKEEAQVFAANDQVYLVKDVFQYNFENITGTNKLKLTSSGMVANWMFYLQRNDVNLRNEWSNYTNWPYQSIPGGLEQGSSNDPAEVYPNFVNVPFIDANGISYDINSGPGMDPIDNIKTGIYLSGNYLVDNQREILNTMGILFNGEYRENLLTSGVFNYVEKYTRTQGSAKDGLYCYNFCLNTSPFEYQPTGAINMSKFKLIQFELTTYVPPIDTESSKFDILCDSSGNAIGVRKSNWRLYQYNYNMTVFEERYNVLSFIGGNCGMLYAR